MIAAGMKAILIKVAGIGLTTEHLGKSLSEMQPTLTKLVRGASFHVHCPQIDEPHNRILCMARTFAAREESTKH